MSDLDLDALEALEKAATPGPWTRVAPAKDADGWSCGVVVAGTPGRQSIYATPPGGSYPSADATLIAAARNALPELIRLARRAERLEKAARELLANLDEYATGAFGGEDELRAALEEEVTR